jgi:hypothetical protein
MRMAIPNSTKNQQLHWLKYPHYKTRRMAPGFVIPYLLSKNAL